MKNTPEKILVAAALAALAVPVIAQDMAKSSLPAGAKTAVHQPAQHGKKTPQHRVAHGVQSRKLTVGEAASLEKQEADLNTEERDLREDNRGRLTAANRAHLQHRQSHASKAIGHNQQSATLANAGAKSKAGNRTSSRQHAASLKTSQLTSSESAPLEAKETSLHREIHSDREEDRGKPTLKKHNARMF